MTLTDLTTPADPVAMACDFGAVLDGLEAIVTLDDVADWDADGADVAPIVDLPHLAAAGAAFGAIRIARRPTIAMIVAAAAWHFRVAPGEIHGERRTRYVCTARQVVMYLARALTGRSLPVVGHALHRDHTTVLHGCRRIEALIAEGDGPTLAAVLSIADRVVSDHRRSLKQGRAA